MSNQIVYLKKVTLFLIFAYCSYSFSCSDQFSELQTEVYDRISRERYEKEQEQRQKRNETLQEDTHMGIYGFYPKGTPHSVIGRNMKLVDVKARIRY